MELIHYRVQPVENKAVMASGVIVQLGLDGASVQGQLYDGIAKCQACEIKNFLTYLYINERLIQIMSL